MGSKPASMGRAPAKYTSPSQWSAALTGSRTAETGAAAPPPAGTGARVDSATDPLAAAAAGAPPAPPADGEVITLKTIVFMGSARNVVPPWGGDARLGDRVLAHVQDMLEKRSEIMGTVTIQHQVQVVDPHEVFAENGALAAVSTGELTVPTFFLSELPPATAELKEQITEADCYVIVSPEYNHTVPPALASVMGHFGGSCYAGKPSAICTYSTGPWGGQRGALSICIMLHELGCLPVSKMCGLPNVKDLLKQDGRPIDPNHRMLMQLPNMLKQLEWMAVAMKRQREWTGPF